MVLFVRQAAANGMRLEDVHVVQLGYYTTKGKQGQKVDDRDKGEWAGFGLKGICCTSAGFIKSYYLCRMSAELFLLLECKDLQHC
jgi:hypothetical protein